MEKEALAACPMDCSISFSPVTIHYLFRVNLFIIPKSFFDHFLIFFLIVIRWAFKYSFTAVYSTRKSILKWN